MTADCFDSHARKGKPVRAGVNPCQWASCSLISGEANSSAALKLPLYKRFNARAQLSIPSGSGRSFVKGTHVDFWAFAHFDFLASVKKVELK